MRSRLYEGRVWHRRRAPREHAFGYRTFYLYLDLGELPDVFDGVPGWSARRPALAWFRRADYHGDPQLGLDAAVWSTVRARFAHAPRGPVRVLTHLRYFGYCFNPVTFYYCFTPDGDALAFVVAEITNTPWHERHAYVLDCRGRAGAAHRFDKAFHVSPFMPMAQSYRWRFGPPGESLTVSMSSHEGGREIFAAGLRLEARPLSAGALTGVLLRHPPMTAKVPAAIYWQAARLKRKGVPFHPHPRHRSADADPMRQAKEMHP